MALLERILKFFTIKDSEAYCETRDKLNQIKKGIGDVNLTRPGCEQSQIVLTDSKWTNISETIGKNIRMIGLEFSTDYKITYNELIDGEFYNHKHTKYYELIYLVSGRIKIIVDGIEHELTEQCRSILINKGSYHQIKGVDAKFVTYYSLRKEILINEKIAYKTAPSFG